MRVGHLAKPPLERVQESEKLLERIVLIVPGFRGYKLREQRREADRIVRDYTYRILQQARSDMTACFQILNDSKATELMDPINRLIARVDRVAEKINHASYGYSGFFDAAGIEETDLERMLNFDSQITGMAGKFAEAASSFKNELSQGRLENARIIEKELEASADALERTFDQRKAAIEGVKV